MVMPQNLSEIINKISNFKNHNCSIINTRKRNQNQMEAHQNNLC